MKKGFTLIELLAVIVILAIVSLIATPLIMNIIDDVQKNAFKNSAYGVVNAANDFIVRNTFNTDDSEEFEFVCDGTSCNAGDKVLPIKGYIPNYGTITINKDGESSLFLSNNKWCAVKNSDSHDIMVKLCDNIFLIKKIDDLVDLSNEVDDGDNKAGKIYVLMNDLDFDNEDDYNQPLAVGDYNGDGVENDIKTELTESTGWDPIGESGCVFSGVFDGLNHKISNLYINRDAARQGLFRTLQGAVIKNLIMEDAEITTGDYSGIIAASLQIGSIIKNSKVSGRITQSGENSYIGLLVGYVSSGGSRVSNCYVNGILIGTDFLGGVAGYVEETSTIENISADDVTIEGRDYIGGIIGVSKAVVYNSNVGSTVTGNKYVGGAIGYSYASTIHDVFSDSTVSGTEIVGGLLGVGAGETMLYNLSAESTVTGSANYIGGLIGRITGSTTLYSSHSITTVSGNNYVGGIMGYMNQSTVYDSYTESTIDAISFSGGLIGSVVNSVVYDLQADSNVTGTQLNIGGLIGHIHNSTAHDLYAKSDVSCDLQQFGGLIGTATSSTIYNSSAETTITGGSYVGGLIGYISESTAHDLHIKSLTIEGTNQVGGLIGFAESSTIYNSYSHGNLTGNEKLGGLIGISNSVVKNSYSAVNITSSTGNGIGGLIGVNGCTNCDPDLNLVQNCYATGNVTINGNSGGGILIGQNGVISEDYSGQYLILRNSYGLGNINGANMLGLIGKNDMVAENIFNGGQVIGTTNTGNIVGVMTEEGASISNSHSVPQNGTITNSTGSTVNKNNLKTSSWFRNTLELDSNWYYEDEYYPLLYKLNENGNPTTTLLKDQIKIRIE